jgi:hypothetical protein
MFQTSLINLSNYSRLLSMSFVMNVVDIYHHQVMILTLWEIDHFFFFPLFFRQTHLCTISSCSRYTYLVMLSSSTLIFSGVIAFATFGVWFTSLPLRAFRPNLGTRFFLGGEDVTVRVFVMLGIYFVSMKYVFVKCKACVCLCETFENLKVLIKRVFL